MVEVAEQHSLTGCFSVSSFLTWIGPIGMVIHCTRVHVFSETCCWNVTALLKGLEGSRDAKERFQ